MFDFDEMIDCRNTHSVKWDLMEDRYGISPEDGLAMWVADMDFRPPASVTRALNDAIANGVFGYFGDDHAYKSAICGWMQRRHGWQVDPDTILSAHGLVAAIGFCLQSFTEPGDGIITFTPVYHAFARIIRANNRQVVESPLIQQGGRYVMDLDALAASLTGRERVLLFCSPHNPGGRVWSRDELRAVADFCVAHDLLLICDEIHHDLVMAGNTHFPMPVAAPHVTGRLIMLTATTKTFNLAGGLTGNAIVPDAALRKRLAATLSAAGNGVNRFGVLMATAAYEGGAEWADALCAYLAGNARLFDDAINAIPGLRSMPLESTYLAWVDFSDTGMTGEEFTARVEKTARIAASHGATFGTGGESFLRFNIGTPRARVIEAAARLTEAFADLQ
jgi:cystathionine beta-lyase